ncbi:MAG TPA: tRNA (N6-isopentenyl adenosine(37)-C2)-methylthiotransferase MiaB [bacterium]|nr:tRNA (N6-isopentenyl adenosine(37)-C2)-methylthiotransferase MiaB [bacterium]
MKKNFAKTYFIITFGCQMNYSDSERIESLLIDHGLVKAKNEIEADLVIINSCSVRQMAEDRTYGKIEKLARLKKRPRIVATGCLVSDKIKNKLLKRERFDLCMPIDRMIDLPKYLNEWKLIKKQDNVLIKEGNYKHYLEIIPKNKQTFSAYIPIMTGCNNFCSYCAVPYTRGREVSRPMDDVVNEAQNLANNGCLELTLLGQNVNSYGNDWKKINTQQGEKHAAEKQIFGNQNKNINHFVELLRKISDIKKLKRILFISSHPKDMSDELIKLVAERDNLCKYIHLPVQAGDNEVLQRMNRQYTREEYLALVNKIRKWIPNVTLTTDLIVGFPGETKKQFEQSVDLFWQCQYDMAFIAEYSPRPKTAACKLKDDVSKAEKHRRKKFLNDEVLAVTALANSQKLVGKTIPVLITRAKQDGKLIGYTEGMKQVHIQGDKKMIGQILPIKISKVMSWALEGKSV